MKFPQWAQELEINERLNLLFAPFPLEDHEFHPYFKFVYLRKQAIIERLTLALGFAWSIVITENPTLVTYPQPVVEGKLNGEKSRMSLDEYCKIAGLAVRVSKGGATMFWDGNTEIDASTLGVKIIPDVPTYRCAGYIDINGNRRYDIGVDVLTDLGKEQSVRIGNTEKGCVTDLYKRLGASVGVGLYLQQLATDGKDVKDDDSLKAFLEKHCGVLEIGTAKAKAFSAAKLLNPSLDGDQFKKIFIDMGVDAADLRWNYDFLVNNIILPEVPVA